MHEVENIEEVLGDKMVLLQEQDSACGNNHAPPRTKEKQSKNKIDDYFDPTVEIGEDINSMEDLVRFPPPVVFRLRMG